MKTILGAYDRIVDAQKTIQELEGNGLDSRAISLVACDEAREGEITDRLAPLVNECERVTIPDLGPSVAAGPLGVAVKHSREGASTSGLIGALTAGGVSPDKARQSLEAVQRGAILVAVHCMDDDISEVMAVINHHNR